MLKQRVITAVILVPIVIWGIFSLPTYPAFATVIAAFVVLGLSEWTRLIHLHEASHRVSYNVVVMALCLSSLLIMQSDFFFAVLLIASVVWWIFQILSLSSFKPNETGFQDETHISHLWNGAFLLVPTFASLCFLHQSTNNGPQLVLTLLILIWSADTGAYFAGKKFGRQKLAPLISPGKTREGAIGALVVTGIVALFAGILLDLGFWQLVFFILLSQLVVIFSIGGDLLESVYKRKAGVKDSGQLLPGHGGMLDRIDSLMAASSLFTLGVWSIGLTS